jgi:hypothetical protein
VRTLHQETGGVDELYAGSVMPSLTSALEFVREELNLKGARPRGAKPAEIAAGRWMLSKVIVTHRLNHKSEMKTPLRIAILECDTPLPDIVAKYGRYDRIFSTLIEAAAEGLSLSPKKDLVLSGFDVVDKQEYPSLEDIDAVLISGSSI